MLNYNTEINISQMYNLTYIKYIDTAIIVNFNNSNQPDTIQHIISFTSHHNQLDKILILSNWKICTEEQLYSRLFQEDFFNIGLLGIFVELKLNLSLKNKRNIIL